MARWGIVSTIKAPAADILRFAAYHLDLGASQITICLDDDNPAAEAALNAHPNCTAIRTDHAYWMDTCGYVPKKHQVRQAQNATRAYHKSTLDWLAHIDVDEFICTDKPLVDLLNAQAGSVAAIRMWPCETMVVEDQPGLGPDLTYCKARPAAGQSDRRLEADLYPTFGGFFKDGFISHTSGKLLARTGRADLHFGIHRILTTEKKQIADVLAPDLELCHRHVESWEKWLKIMQFRLERGSYRAELDANLDPTSGRMSRNTLFTALQNNGLDDLRAFFEEVCLATPRLRERLEAHGLLRSYTLNLSPKVQKHFPGFML